MEIRVRKISIKKEVATTVRLNVSDKTEARDLGEELLLKHIREARYVWQLMLKVYAGSTSFGISEYASCLIPLSLLI